MLKLTALDADDLAIISVHMQDAVLKLGDIAFTPNKKQFALVANRFAWDEANTRQRRRTGVHFDRVLSVKSQNLRQDDPGAILSLLSIIFTGTNAPSGEILLSFSGGGSIRLAVECIEASLKDLGPAWATARQPSHGDESRGA